MGISRDEEKLKDSICYVPSRHPDNLHTRNNLRDVSTILSQMKFGKLANEKSKRDLATGLFLNKDILLPHQTARVKEFEYRILLKSDEPINSRRRQSPDELNFNKRS